MKKYEHELERIYCNEAQYEYRNPIELAKSIIERNINLFEFAYGKDEMTDLELPFIYMIMALYQFDLECNGIKNDDFKGLPDWLEYYKRFNLETLREYENFKNFNYPGYNED